MKSRPFLAAATLAAFIFLACAGRAAAGATPSAAPVVAQPSAIPGLKPIDYKADPQITEYAKQAGSIAIAEWISEFFGKPVDAKRFAVLPLANDLDDGYFTLQARNEFANRALGTEFSLYTRDDPEWAALLSEIRRGDQEGDTMDQATIQKFGRVQGVQGIIRGRVTGVFLGDLPSSNAVGLRLADDAKVLQVRIALQAFEVETGRQLWGTEKVAAVGIPGETLEVNVTRAELVGYAGGALLLIVVLFLILRAMKSAGRPR